MQRRNVGKAMCWLVAVLALVSSLGMFACSSDNPETRNVSATVSLDANTVQALVGQPITIPNGAVFGAAGNAVTLTFNTPSTFTLVRGTTTSTGNVTFGPCTFTGTGQTPITFSTCNIVISADNVEVGGASVSGTITLVLANASGTATSISITVQVLINDAGELFVINPVNGTVVDTGVNTNVTGTTGSGGR